MKQNRSRVSGGQLLESVTSYPWHRDYKGDLCGTDGQPIYFGGADAVIIEHSPEMAETLETVRKIAAAHDPIPTAALKQIFQVAHELIRRIERAKTERKWCRGAVRS